MSKMSTALLKKAIGFGEGHEALIKILREAPVLSREEEQKLFRALREKPDDKALKDKIILANLRLVARWAGKIAARRRSTTNTLDFRDLFWDLFQTGTLGLMTAIERFDPELNNKFSTYGTYWIRQAILRSITETGRPIRIPVYLNDKLGTFFRVQDQIRQKTGEEPSPEEIALGMNISLEKVFELQGIIIEGKIISLYVKNSDDDERSLIDILPGKDNDPDAAVGGTLLKEAVRRMIEDSLGIREGEILKLRFGLEDGKSQTLDKVGKKFGLTRERIRQIEAAALRKLRQPKYRKSFKDFVE